MYEIFNFIEEGGNVNILTKLQISQKIVGLIAKKKTDSQQILKGIYWIHKNWFIPFKIRKLMSTRCIPNVL